MQGPDHGDEGGPGARSGTGKRRRDRGRCWAAGAGASGFGSGDEMEQAEYKGVKDFRLVEIESLVEGVNFTQDVTGMSLQQAAMMHDLAWAYAWAYANRDHFDREQLNIQRLADEMALFGPALSIDELMKFLIIEIVIKNPLKAVGVDPQEWVDSIRDHVVALVPDAFQALTEWIAENSFRAGRQWQDQDEIMPAIEENNPPEDLEDENQRLKKAKADEQMRIRMLMLCAPPGAPNPELRLTDLNKHLLKDNERLETLVEAKVAEIASLKNELRAARGTQSSPHSPTLGLPGSWPGASSECEFRALSGLVSSVAFLGSLRALRRLGEKLGATLLSACLVSLHRLSFCCFYRDSGHYFASRGGDDPVNMLLNTVCSAVQDN